MTNQNNQLKKLPTNLNIEIRQLFTQANPIYNPEREQWVYERLVYYYRCIVFAYTGAEPQEMAFFAAKFRGLAQWICNSSAHKRCLIIGGPAGIGKTTIAKALQMFFNQDAALYGSVMQMSAKDVGDYYRFRDDGEKWDIYTGKATVVRYNQPPQPRCKILFVDDLGMEEDDFRDYGTKTQPMAKLIHDRHERGLVTIFSTNLGCMDMLREKYDDRIMDRMNSYCKLFYTMPSLRR